MTKLLTKRGHKGSKAIFFVRHDELSINYILRLIYEGNAAILTAPKKETLSSFIKENKGELYSLSKQQKSFRTDTKSFVLKQISCILFYMNGNAVI